METISSDSPLSVLDNVADALVNEDGLAKSRPWEDHESEAVYHILLIEISHYTHPVVDGNTMVFLDRNPSPVHHHNTIVTCDPLSSDICHIRNTTLTPDLRYSSHDSNASYPSICWAIMTCSTPVGRRLSSASDHARGPDIRNAADTKNTPTERWAVG